MMYESAKLYFLCGLKNLSNEFLGLRPEKIIKKSEVLSNDGKSKKNPDLLLPEANIFVFGIS